MNRFLPALLLLVCQLSAAQAVQVVEVPGSVSVEECSLKSYPSDPQASAVILWENCDEVLEQDMLRGYMVCRTTVTQRLKIFRSSASHYANLVMELGSDQTLKDVSITTFNLDKGEIKKFSCSKNDLFKKRIDSEIQEVTLYAQKVRAGSVVEISYTLVQPVSTDPHVFEFQRSVPVNLITYKIKIPEWLKARKSLLNSNDAVEYHQAGPVDTFRAAGLPAFKEEPMVYCPDQYRAMVRYEYAESGSYAKDWAGVAKMYKDSPVMIQLAGRTPIRKAVREVAATEDDDPTKITKIMALAYTKVRWNREIGVMPFSFDMIGTPEFGNSADINSFVGAALTEAGYTVTPVFIRTRSAGMLLPECPSADAFNTYVLHVTKPETEGGIDAILDASNTNLYLNVLPDEFLVGNAFEVNRDGTYNWLDLTNLSRNISSWNAIAYPKPDGNMDVNVVVRNFNTSSFNFKDTYGHSSDSLLVEQVKSLIDCDSMSRIEVLGFGEFAPTSYLSVDYSKQSKVGADGSITVNPFITDFLPEKPFREQSRRLPMDFSYPETVDYSFRAAIPQGYDVAELPQNASIAAEGVPTAVILRWDVDRNADEPSVGVKLKFVNEALVVSPEQYPALREMWLKAASALAECRIVFNKK